MLDNNQTLFQTNSALHHYPGFLINFVNPGFDKYCIYRQATYS